MADYSVSMDGANSFSVSVEKTIVADKLSELSDVSVSDLPNKDQYVLTYNATTQKYQLVPADNVLTTAANDSQLPTAFVQQLEVDLDNQIDVDGGSF
jgi:hypothetical protein